MSQGSPSHTDHHSFHLMNGHQCEMADDHSFHLGAVQNNYGWMGGCGQMSIRIDIWPLEMSISNGQMAMGY